MKKGWVVAIVVIVAVCGGGGIAVNAVQRALQAKKEETPEVKVERGPIQVKVVESGTLIAFTNVEVKSRVGGRVARLLVDEGDMVEKGQLIAVIDPQETQLQVEQSAAQVRGAQAGLERTSVEIAQRRVTARAALERAQSNLRQVQLELASQPAVTSSAVASARSGLAVARQAEDQLKNVTHPSARIEAQNNLDDAVANRQKAESEAARQASLLDRGYVSRREAEAASVQLTVARSREASARQVLATLAESHRIEAAQAAERVRQAQAELDRALANTVQDSVKAEQLRQAQASVREAAAQLRDVDALAASRRQQSAQVDQLSTVLRDGQRQLGETRILAPISGVVSKRYVQIGELVASLNSFSAGSPIFRIEDRSRMLIKLEVNEIDVARLAVGMEAEIAVDALPDSEFSGRVTKIAPTSLSSLQAQVAAPSTGAVVKYEVEVTVGSPDLRLKSGMSAKCTMLVLNRERVLRVPLDYLGKDADGDHLMVVGPDAKPDDKGKRTPVKVGERSATHAEILEGAEEGATLRLPEFKGPARQGMMSFGDGDGDE
jgi:HlyD family secretion protein